MIQLDLSSSQEEVWVWLQGGKDSGYFQIK